ncbi:hypothetical protein GMRT_11021 [Giardia muris]|uniref:Uncharacterized protein n=1 Tax=Giardia muris TaxID=5742 RepID=A0A4Z1SNI1_GIAMU|nr:hypothetical protein GMRT_11021 [Giardia muris]|eukprot:TNJ27190.1 hypothetical protein GMRT_11021 [Giardia muris]
MQVRCMDAARLVAWPASDAASPRRFYARNPGRPFTVVSVSAQTRFIEPTRVDFRTVTVGTVCTATIVVSPRILGITSYDVTVYALGPQLQLSRQIDDVSVTVTVRYIAKEEGYFRGSVVIIAKGRRTIVPITANIQFGQLATEVAYKGRVARILRTQCSPGRYGGIAPRPTPRTSAVPTTPARTGLSKTRTSPANNSVSVPGRRREQPQALGMAEAQRNDDTDNDSFDLPNGFGMQPLRARIQKAPGDGERLSAVSQMSASWGSFSVDEEVVATHAFTLLEDVAEANEASAHSWNELRCTLEDEDGVEPVDLSAWHAARLEALMAFAKEALGAS